MNRLRQPGDSHYDVLGLSPGASEQEIERAFRQLIDGEGYRVGVPLNRQWLRARQIKDAHETLGDPERRRTYDETLGEAAETAPWAMTAADPGTDELVLSENAPEIPEQVESGLAPDEGVPSDAGLADSEPEAVPEVASGPEEEAELVHDDPLAPNPSPSLNDNEPAPESADDVDKRSPLRNWRVAAAAASVLGLVLVASWSGLKLQPSASEGTAGVAGGAWQASRGGQGSVPQAPGNLGGSMSLAADNSGIRSDEPPTAPDQPTGLQQPADEDATSGVAEVETAAIQSPAAATAANTAAPASVQPSGQTAIAESRAPPQPPPVAAAPAIEPAPGRVERTGGSINRSAQWIGGGPTDADNPRGRYQGNLEVQVMVEANGRVSNCAPVRGSGNGGLDALTCRLVKERARFNPALDAQGRPVASEIYTTFVWGRGSRE